MTLAPIDNNEEKAETDLAIIPTETPDDVLATAKRQAKALMGILQYGKHYIEKNGNKYLKVEAWQTFLAFDNVRAETQWVKPIRDDDGTIVAYQAEVALLDKRNGRPRGKAIMSCGLDENVCQGKAGYAKTIAAESMAQTRAESKACRQNYAFVAVLAGYKPTPAEEMMFDEEDEEPQTKRFAPPQQRAQPVVVEAQPIAPINVSSAPVAQPVAQPVATHNEIPHSFPCPIHSGENLEMRDGKHGIFWSHRDAITLGYCNVGITYPPKPEFQEAWLEKIEQAIGTDTADRIRAEGKQQKLVWWLQKADELLTIETCMQCTKRGETQIGGVWFCIEHTQAAEAALAE